jgi:hypothetical protein
VMGSILLLLFSYTLQPKRRIWRKKKWKMGECTYRTID